MVADVNRSSDPASLGPLTRRRKSKLPTAGFFVLLLVSWACIALQRSTVATLPDMRELSTLEKIHDDFNVKLTTITHVANGDDCGGVSSNRRTHPSSLIHRSSDSRGNGDSHVTVAVSNLSTVEKRANAIKFDDANATDKTLSSVITPAAYSTPDDRNEIVFSHYLGHIPKSGTTFAFGVIAELVHKLSEQHNITGTDLFRPCNEGTKRVKEWKTFSYQHKGRKCTMWMTEPGWYNADAEHRYIILREPISHTLSMYFHCKESKEHSNQAHLMPSLDEWINAWYAFQTNTSKWQENNEFQCYNPTNFQSRAISYNSELGKEDIRRKWDIIGDTSQMDQTICLIVIKYTGWVPSECNCTNAAESQNHRRLHDLTYDKNVHAHGVTHHGSDFEITDEQRKVIQGFRKTDMELYDLVAHEIFEEQVQEVEQDYDVKLCNTLQVRGTWMEPT